MIHIGLSLEINEKPMVATHSSQVEVRRTCTNRRSMCERAICLLINSCDSVLLLHCIHFVQLDLFFFSFFWGEKPFYFAVS